MTEGAAPDFSGAAELTAGIERSLGRVAGEVHASDVFGVAHESGDRVVITAAALERAGGFGFGSGGGGEGAEAGSGGGGGGGGSAAGRPVAAIEIAPDGVRVHAIVDTTRIGIAGLAALMALFRGRAMVLRRR